VATGEHRGEDSVQHVALAHDPLPDLREQVLSRRGESLEQLDIA
jgi:hypothetical protein